MKKNKDWNGYNGELDIIICFCKRNCINEFVYLLIGILWDEIKKKNKNRNLFNVIKLIFGVN